MTSSRDFFLYKHVREIVCEAVWNKDMFLRLRSDRDTEKPYSERGVARKSVLEKSNQRYKLLKSFGDLISL